MEGNGKKSLLVNHQNYGIDYSTIRYKKKRRCSCCRSVWCHLVGFLISLSLLIFFATTIYPEEVVYILAVGQLPIAPGTKRATDWMNGEPHLTYKFYIFNLTNVDQFLGGDLPRVKEIGPFTYDVVEKREEVKYDGVYISFRSRPIFRFRKELSVGDDDLMIKTLNIPLVNAGDILKGFVPNKILGVVRDTLSVESVRTLTVKELLWGHQSKLLNLAKKFKDIPYPYKEFALLSGRNDTLQPVTIINSGMDNVSEMNQVIDYGGDVLKTDCHAPKGTDGSGFGPRVNKSQTLYIYNGQICRSLPLLFQEEYKTDDGLVRYKFVMPPDVFSYTDQRHITLSLNQNQSKKHDQIFTGNYKFNYHTNFIKSFFEESEEDDSNETLPEWKQFYGKNNQCFCHGRKCLPDGLMDMRPCLFDAAVAFSFPHFMNGDPMLRHKVRGLRPVPEKHNTEFDIFPDLGIPLRVKLRMQMNVVIDENQALNRARHFDLIYPIFWFEAGIDSLPPAIVQQLQMAQDLPPLMKTVCLAVTCFSTVVFLVLLFAHTVINLCTSTLSSLRSRSLRGSSEGTRSTTPDLDEQETRALDQTDAVVANAVQDSASEGKNSYTAYNTPQELDNEVRGRLVDNGTMLPPYREKSRAQQRQSFASDATDTLTRSEPDPIYNEYPPDYHAATVTQNNVSDGPLYQQHTHQVAAEVHTNSSRPAVIAAHNRSNNGYLSQMEHKSIVHPQPLASTNRTHDTLQTSSAHPVMSAPLASAEDFSFAGYGNSLLDSQKESLVAQQQEPLATSSPHLSQDDIEVQRGALQNSGGGSPTYVNISQASDMTVVPEQNYSFRDHRDASFMKVEEPGVRGAVSPVERRHTLPSHSGYKKLHNASLPPPLESDL